MRPGRQRDFETWAAGVTEAASRFPGHGGATLLTPTLTGAPDNLLVFRFDTAEHLVAWDQSDVKREWLAKIEDATEDVSAERATGLEFWFRLPGVPASATPPRAKMAVVTLVAIYPLALLAQLFVAPRLAALPVAVRVMVIVAGMVVLMTYAVMPVLVRLFKPWLFRPRPPRP